jgi:hypothetical protein
VDATCAAHSACAVQATSALHATPDARDRIPARRRRAGRGTSTFHLLRAGGAPYGSRWRSEATPPVRFSPKVRPGRGAAASPQETLVELHAPLVEKLALFLLKRVRSMMFLLSGDVSDDLRQLASSKREGAVSLLPGESLLPRMFVHPHGRGVLDIAKHRGQAVHRTKTGGDVDVIVGPTDLGRDTTDPLNAGTEEPVKIVTPGAANRRLTALRAENDVVVERGVCRRHDDDRPSDRGHRAKFYRTWTRGAPAGAQRRWRSGFRWRRCAPPPATVRRASGARVRVWGVSPGSGARVHLRCACPVRRAPVLLVVDSGFDDIVVSKPSSQPNGPALPPGRFRDC